MPKCLREQIGKGLIERHREADVAVKVKHAWRLHAPCEECAKLGGVLIRSCKLNPIEQARCVLLDLGHERIIAG